MSPTLLEGALALLLIWVAWQLGVALTPIIRRWLRALRQDLDDAHEDALANDERDQQR